MKFVMFALIGIYFFIGISEIHCEKHSTTLEKPWLSEFEDVALKNQTVLWESTLKNGEGMQNFRQWFLDIPILPIVFAQSNSVSEGPCKRQARRFLRDLQNGTLWAVQMYDASAKYPDGVLQGHLQHFGNFDECVNIAVTLDNDNGAEEISGRYCLVDITYEKKDLPPIIAKPHTFDFDPTDTVWESIREKGDIRRTPRYKLQMALCVPSVCTAEDVEMMLKYPLEQYAAERNITVDTSVQQKFSQALNEAPAITAGVKIFCGVVAILFALVVLATRCDDDSLEATNLKEKRSIVFDILDCFSARRNLQNLLRVKDSHTVLDSIHLIRFFFSCLVIYVHSIVEYYYDPLLNTEYLERMYGSSIFMLMFNATVITDGFFAIGGLLLAYGLLEHLDKSRRINFFFFIFVRFIRYTPSYMLVIAFYATIFPYLGSGPLWKAQVDHHANTCTDLWWANLFNINNYVKCNDYCVFQSWYIPVDFQLFVISVFVIYGFWRCPRYIGYAALGLMTIGSCLIPAYITYSRSLGPTFLGYARHNDLREHHYFMNYYVKTHMRGGSYFVGVIVGALIYDYRQTDRRLSKVCSHIFCIAFVVILPIVTILLGFRYLDPSYNPSLLEIALYAGFHRAVYAVSVVSVVILLMFGSEIDFYFNFFTPTWVRPLSKLTYGAYLVHNILQLYRTATARMAKVYSIYYKVRTPLKALCRSFQQEVSFSVKKKRSIFVKDGNPFILIQSTDSDIWTLPSELVISFFLSLLLEFAVEGPTKQLKTLLFTQISREKTGEKQTECVQKKTE